MSEYSNSVGRLGSEIRSASFQIFALIALGNVLGGEGMSGGMSRGMSDGDGKNVQGKLSYTPATSPD